MTSWEQYADAILLTWQPGEQAGNAVADILLGKVNPSGKLPLTFPKRLEDSPSFGNYPGNAKTVIYGEGIYVGYRYFDTKRIAPMYPFGYGLSYSTVNYGKISPENRYSTSIQRIVLRSVSLYVIPPVSIQKRLCSFMFMTMPHALIGQNRN